MASAKTPKQFTLLVTKYSRVGGESRTREMSGTLSELVQSCSYTLETGKSYEHEKGNKKINLNPKSISGLVTALNNAVNNAAADGCANSYYSLKDEAQ